MVSIHENINGYVTVHKEDLDFVNDEVYNTKTSVKQVYISVRITEHVLVLCNSISKYKLKSI